MDRYLIISAHTKEDCKAAVEHFAQYYAGYIKNFEWGCLDNDHNAYAIIEAESHKEALMSVPPILRNKAKVIRITTFTPAQVHSIIHGTGLI